VALARQQGLPDQVRLFVANYAELPRILDELSIDRIDGILLDLGLSSDQMGDYDRGFSFQGKGLLDMRFDPTAGEPAWQLVNRMEPDKLADLIYQYGEERYSRRIARRIADRRAQQPIRTAEELAELVRQVVPRSRRQRIDPATRTFQALRIAVNDELHWLETALTTLPQRLKPGGRIAVISFHSLEDRIVKHRFRDDPALQVLTRKPIRPSPAEMQENPRSRSSRLRVAQRLDSPPSESNR
jgi:16S rRNA (cytosine1402-N4)-methyltransferase